MVDQTYPPLELSEKQLSFARSSYPATVIPQDRKNVDDQNYLRKIQMAAIHESQIERFADAPGFGVSRGPFRSQAIAQYDTNRDQTAERQPGEQFTVSYLDGWDEHTISKIDRKKELHEQFETEFISPKRWGYETEPRKFVGFRSHRIDTQAGDYALDTGYKLEAVELVGLLMAEQPRVYQTVNLPSMTEAKNAPTRPLDAFEAKGLDAIAAGETLFVMENKDKKLVRMVGAIRADQNCAKCHDVKNGELLGLFSYTLRAKK